MTVTQESVRIIRIVHHASVRMENVLLGPESHQSVTEQEIATLRGSMARTNVVWRVAHSGQMNLDVETVTGMVYAVTILIAEITWDVTPTNDVFVVVTIPAQMDKFVMQLEIV